MPLIAVGHGEFAVVDDEDWGFLTFFGDWCLLGKDKSLRYPVTRQRRELIMMHRLVAKRIGLDCSLLIDHHDRDTLNCRRYNLRPATHQQNMCNSRTRIDNSSGIKGVYFHRRSGKWVAQITVNGKWIYVGLYDKLEDAAAAYELASKRYHGVFSQPH